MSFKNCTKCGKEFPATNEFFRKCPNGKMGLYAWCRPCEKQNRLENIEHRREIERRSYTKNREKYNEHKRERNEHLRNKRMAAGIIAIKRTPTNAVRTGITPKNFKDLSGQRFGRLAVIERAGNIGEHPVKWLCKCDCGNEKAIDGNSLRMGKTKSCGCFLSETVRKRKMVHGFYGERLYNIWQHMKDRCYYPRNDNYKNYGGRGISVCDEWKENYSAFKEWALNNGYSDSLTIDRKNNDGNYEPGNCRWATIDTQSNNKQNTVYITINGETHNLKEWSELSNIPRIIIYGRFKRGWSEDRLLEPIK